MKTTKLIGIVAVLSVFATCVQAEDPVYFPDANLKAAVEQALSITDPTPTDMLTLTAINAPEQGIADLTGMEHAVNLAVLDLGDNQISNLSPLSGLTNLTSLQLYGNQISDLSPLSALTTLTVLVLSGDKQLGGLISDITPLSPLTGLVDLWLTNNQISDISALSGMTKLRNLYVALNQISNLTPLSELHNLQWLNLANNQISDISLLSGLTNIIVLELGWNQISDISSLSGLTNLTLLRLANNQISDIGPLSGLTNVTNIELADNLISDIGPLSGLTNLTFLGLGGEQISDISPLSGLTNLTGLGLRDNQINDINPLSGLTNLNFLDLNNNQLSDLTPLSGLTNMHNLRLGRNQISNISPLSGLTNLVSLVLAQNQISNLTPLSGLTNLQGLFLTSNQINDLGPLSGLTNLGRLDLGNNQITDVSLLAGLTSLEVLFLENNQISNISVVANMLYLHELRLQQNLISDLSPLSELYQLHRLDLQSNPLNSDAFTTYIPQIISNNPDIQILYDPPVAPGENILVNGGFESGAMSPWVTGATAPALITAGVVGELVGAAIPDGPIEGSSCLHVAVSETNENWWLTGVFYDGIAFQAGKRYTLSAFLKCKEGTRRINFKPELTGDPWDGYGEQQFTITDEWAEYSVTTPVFVSNVSPAQITFHVGFADGEFWMDCVRFYEGDYVPVETELTFRAREPNPSPGAGDVPTEVTLSWTAGMGATSHHIYFGTNLAYVIARTTGDTDKGTQTENSYSPGALAYGTTYYWCIDEFDGTTMHAGNIWSFTTQGQGEGHILFEHFWGTDASLNTLLTLPAFPDNPDQSELRTSFEGPTNWRYNYGTYVRGYLYPPQTGSYTFWIASDDQSLLWLSTDENPANAVKIARVKGWTPERDFDNQFGGAGGPEQKSNPVSLEADRIYYIEALCAQGIGGDNLAVAWQGPSIMTRQVISGTFLSPYNILGKATNSSPDGNGAVGVPIEVTLTWTAGIGAVSHHIYFGTNRADVIAGIGGTDKDTQTETSYAPEVLAYGTTYYWRVDEFDGIITHSGSIWSFTTRGRESLQMWFGAEGGSIGLPMEILDDATAFGGQYIVLPTVGTNSADWPPPDGHVTYSFSVPTGTYMVWGRIKALSDVDDSFWARIEGASTNTNNHPSGWIQWWGIKKGTDWFWNPICSYDDGNAAVRFTLAEGSYTLEIAYKEDGTKLDHLLITDYLNLTADEISGITPTGSYTEVAPVDSQTGGTPVTLTFDNITESGGTTLVTYTSGPPVPTGFQLLDTYYDISTTASFTGTIQIAIEYDDSGLILEEELILKLWHYDDALQEWIDVTTGIDTTNNIIYGETDHLSSFVITVNMVVGIDIKPGSYPNSFNMNGHGLIPVAILGSASFDVTKIDVITLSLAGLEVRVKPNGTPQCSVEDVSGKEGTPDGYPDLVCQFVDNPDNWLLGETEEATVTGYLKEQFGGIFIEGSDEIRIVP